MRQSAVMSALDPEHQRGNKRRNDRRGSNQSGTCKPTKERSPDFFDFERLRRRSAEWPRLEVVAPGLECADQRKRRLRSLVAKLVFKRCADELRRHRPLGRSDGR